MARLHEYDVQKLFSTIRKSKRKCGVAPLMIALELIKNISLLVVLVVIYRIAVARLQGSLLTYRLLFGALFGFVAIIGMMSPIHYGNGVFFDGRSIVLAVAGLVGGPLVAFISASVSAAYRLWLGGGGAPVGVAVIITSSALGVVFYFIRKKLGKPLGATSLFGFGLLVHAVMLALFQLLPDRAGEKVIQDLGIVIILLYPLATMLICLLFQDYEEKEAARKSLEHLAYYDSLTGLPNRTFLTEKLQQSLNSCNTNHSVGGLILINLDRFKTVNDACGHAAGDLVLRSITDRLKSLLGSNVLLARMSSDEFAILTDSLTFSDSSSSAILELAEKANLSIKIPQHIKGMGEISMSASIGIAYFPQGTADSVGDVLRRTDTALHRAKQNGKNQIAVFDKSMTLLVEQRFQIERDLKKAILDGSLRFYLQSQVNPDGEVVGAEALVRWQHPEQGLLSPALFIPIAEETDLIIEVGEWVLTEACRILAQDRMKFRNIRLSVNVSPKQFIHSGFVSSVKEKLAMTGADPGKLTLEVTEGLLIHQLGEIVQKILELRELGIRFSLDDFGTGYSSLSYLQRLPIQEIKIDKIFVQDAPTNKDNAALVETIFSVAQHMNLAVVAEGVETQEQADFLSKRGKVIHQGYLFSRPEPATVWLSRLD